jgi:type II secretory pathway predicted ATPase ExeA
MVMAFAKYGWKEDPFTLKIDPKLFTGYEEQVKAALTHVENRHKIALVTGSTGAGKTHMLKWLENSLDKCAVLYVSKPPATPEGFIDIFTELFGLGFMDRIFNRRPTLYGLPKYINAHLRGAHLVFLLDEAHETNRDVLEWLRVLLDQIDSVSLIMAGLPNLEPKVRDELQTLDQRITTRITLTALDRQNTRMLIKKRIESAGGMDIKPFTDSAVDVIYNRTGGFPREVLKMCDRLVHDAVEKNLETIEAANIEEYREVPQSKVRVEEPTVTFSPKPPSEEKIANLPFKQRQILESLEKADWLTPTAIVDKVGIEGYATRQHAVRSINNILHRLMLDGFVQRESRGKAFMYALTPKVRTLFVEN